MKRLAIGFVVAGLLAGTSGTAVAQSQGWAMTPFAAYVQPSGNLVEGPFLDTDPSGGFVVGIIGELGLTKQLAVSAFASSTVGLSSTLTATYKDPSNAANNSEFDFANAWTQLGGTAIIRPLGRLPNGAPKIFWLEAGAAITRFSLADVQDRSGGTSLSWTGNFPSVVFGGGFTLRLTPRMTAVLFGRYSLALSEYSSDGLDDWNSPCSPGDATCIDAGQKVNLLQVGVGFRSGR